MVSRMLHHYYASTIKLTDTKQLSPRLANLIVRRLPTLNKIRAIRLGGISTNGDARIPRTSFSTTTRERPNALIPSQQHQQQSAIRPGGIATPHQRKIQRRLATTTKPALRPSVATFYTNNNTSRPQIKSSEINFQRCPGTDLQRCPHGH